MSQLAAAAELAREVAAGEVSAADVVEKCLGRIRQREPQLNAVAVPLAQLARELAARVDDRVRKGEEPGPLAGVPFTVKECYHVAGTRHSLGLANAAERAERHSPIVQRLIDAGAIPVAKTNLSQLMLLYETDNPLYGRTNHPQSADRSPGGSGGGDAAALAAGYACFAIGTDMGGSARHPAHSCGLAALLPTRHRIENVGVERILPRISPLDLQVAPLARHVEDLELVMRVLTDDGRADGCLAAPRVGGGKSVSEMRIGYFESEQYFAACPTVRRAVRETAASLEGQGAELVEMPPPDLRRAVHLFCGFFGADGGRHIRDRLRGEQVDWRTRPLLQMGRLPRAARSAIARVAQWLGQCRLAGILDHSYRCSAATLWRLSEAIARYRGEFFEQLAAAGLDAVVMPAHATIAYRHGGSHHMLPATGYSMLANLLGAPAGVVPATAVREDEQTMDINRRSRSERAALDSLRGSAGLPCGVQILAAPWHDATVLRLMTAVEGAAGR